MAWILTALLGGFQTGDVVARLGSRDYATRLQATRECQTMDPLRFAVVYATANRSGSPEARLRAQIVRDRRFPCDEELTCLYYLRSSDSEATIAASLLANATVRWHTVWVLRREFRRLGVFDPVDEFGWEFRLLAPIGVVVVPEADRCAALARQVVELRNYRQGVGYGGNRNWPGGRLLK